MDVPRPAIVLDTTNSAVYFPDRFSRKRERVTMNPVVHTENRVTDFRDQVEVVRHHENRHLLFQQRERFNKLLLDREIDIGGRLIKEEKFGLASEGSRDENPLALTAGKIGEGAVCKLLETDLGKSL